MLELYASGLYLLNDPKNYLLLILGTFIGIFFGSLPGLTSTMALAVFTPLTFGLSAGSSIFFLMAIYAASVFGGAITAIVINIPGTPAAIVTGLDGYPLSQKGEAGKAITVATISSVTGSLFGLIVLMILAPFLVQAVRHFGSQEYTAVTLLGLSMISYISSPGRMVNGLIGATIGLLIANVGQDPLTAFPRFSMGIPELAAGFNDIVIMIGAFGIGEILYVMSQSVEVQYRAQRLKLEVIQSFKLCFSYIRNILRSSVIGTFIGILPAAGGAIGSVVAYGVAKQVSKKPEEFGEGSYEGIMAAEGANNASVGGALVPMMTLGIPGDPMTAVLIGALMLHGLTPGPLLFEQSPDVVSSVFIGLFLATIFMLIMGLLGAGVFSRVLTVSTHYLMPFILILSMIGAYVLRFSIFDVGAAFVFGIVTFFLRKVHVPPAPLILGLILGPKIEENFRRAIILGDGSVLPFFTRPLSLFFIVVTVVLFILGIIQNRRLVQQSLNSRSF